MALKNEEKITCEEFCTLWNEVPTDNDGNASFKYLSTRFLELIMKKRQPAIERGDWEWFSAKDPKNPTADEQSKIDKQKKRLNIWMSSTAVNYRRKGIILRLHKAPDNRGRKKTDISEVKSKINAAVVGNKDAYSTAEKRAMEDEMIKQLKKVDPSAAKAYIKERDERRKLPANHPGRLVEMEGKKK